MAKRDNHLAARALADWAFYRFQNKYLPTVATQHNIAARTLERWKAALGKDAELSAKYDSCLQELLSRSWAEGLDEALTEAINRMRELMKGSQNLEHVTNAFESLSEVAMTREILNVQPGDAKPYSADSETS